MSDLEYVFVVSDAEAAQKVSAALGELGSVSPEVAQLHGLGGSIGEWMVAGTAATYGVARLLKAIYPFVEARRITSIKAGDVEIAHPRPQHVTKLLEMHFAEDPDQPGLDG